MKITAMAVIALMVATGTIRNVRAMDRSAAPIASASASGSDSLAGIRADRLSPRQLRIWRSIERIVLARDQAGRALHPNLRELWQQVQASSHVVFIVLQDQREHGHSDCAGRFAIDEFDPAGERHVASVQLNLAIIDRAYIDPASTVADGFAQFTGLSREERYVEVLGHELAHAVWSFQDVARARMIVERYELGKQLSIELQRDAKQKNLSPKTRDLMARLRSLGEVIEEPAYTMEAKIWQELVSVHLGQRELPGATPWTMRTPWQ